MDACSHAAKIVAKRGFSVSGSPHIVRHAALCVASSEFRLAAANLTSVSDVDQSTSDSFTTRLRCRPRQAFVATLVARRDSSSPDFTLPGDPLLYLCPRPTT